MTSFVNALLSGCLLFVLYSPVATQAAVVMWQTPASRSITGEVVDQSTGKAIPYASIGIMGEATGTVSTDEGKFSLAVPAALHSKAVRISALGYEPREIKAAELLSLPTSQETVRIALAPKPVQLAEVEVNPKHWKTKNLGGNAGPITMVHHNFALLQLPLQENLGHEMGIQINSGQKPTFLQELNFCLTMNKYEMVRFRVNVYSVKDGLPFQNVSPKDIYVTVHNKKQGWIAVDLEPYDLYMENDFVIALEWIDCLPKKESLPLTIAGSLPGFHSTYHKDASQATWQKLSPLGIGMNVVVLREKGE